MSRLIMGSIALALAIAAGRAEAREWICGAKAKVADSSVGTYVLSGDDGGLLLKSGVAIVEYVPAPPRHGLDLILRYAVDLSAKTLVAVRVVSTAHVERYDAGGHLVLNLGQAASSWPVSSAFFFEGYSSDMWIDREPDKALSEALVSGGPAEFFIVDPNGKVRRTRSLNILGTDQLLSIVAKAYPVAAGFAAAPQHSPYCEMKTGPTPPPPGEIDFGPVEAQR